MVTSSFPRFPGDFAGFMVHEQALALSRNHTVHVIYPDNLKRIQPGAEPFFRHPVSYPLRSYPLAQVRSWELPGAAWLLADMAREVRKVRRQAGIELFYAFWTIPSGFITSVACGRVPMLLGLMGSDLEVFGKRSLTRRFISRAIKRADGIVSVSEDLKTEAIGLGGRAETIEVIPTGVDITRFKPMDKCGLRAKLGIPNTFTWLYSGSLFKLKRVQWVLRLCAALGRDFDFQVVIVGDGPEREELERLASSLGVVNVSFRGRVSREDMPLYVAASDVLLLFSETEGLPNCVMEAMAGGIPVVATRVGGLPDIVADGVTGYLVEDEAQAEDRLRRLMSSPALAREFGSKALARARCSLATSVIFEKIENLCEATARRAIEARRR